MTHLFQFLLKRNLVNEAFATTSSDMARLVCLSCISWTTAYTGQVVPTQGAEIPGHQACVLARGCFSQEEGAPFLTDIKAPCGVALTRSINYSFIQPTFTGFIPLCASLKVTVTRLGNFCCRVIMKCSSFPPVLNLFLSLL